MKNLALIFAVLVLSAGCSRCSQTQEIAVKVNNYEISRAEFEQEFKESSFAALDTPQSRKDFLENLVNRILILQDAQKQGLDKDPKFLKMVEKFWAQSLLRLAIEKKSKEFKDSGPAGKTEDRFTDEWLVQLHKAADIRIDNDLVSGK